MVDECCGSTAGKKEDACCATSPPGGGCGANKGTKAGDSCAANKKDSCCGPAEVTLPKDTPKDDCGDLCCDDKDASDKDSCCDEAGACTKSADAASEAGTCCDDCGDDKEEETSDEDDCCDDSGNCTKDAQVDAVTKVDDCCDATGKCTLPVVTKTDVKDDSCDESGKCTKPAVPTPPKSCGATSDSDSEADTIDDPLRERPSASSCRRRRPRRASPDPIKTHKHTPCRVADCSTRKKRRSDRTMCGCCVQTMMRQPSAQVARSLLEAAAQVQSAARRCCIAFANYCCPALDACAAAPCCDEDEVEALLAAAALPSPKVEIAAGAQTEAFALEVGGMDCPDCLSKVRRVFDALPGTKITRMDYVRALVEAEREVSAAEPEVIGRFVTRATGFPIRVVYGSAKGGGTVVPLRFEALPPASVLAAYETADVRPHKAGGEVDFVFAEGGVPPREVLSRLEDYGAVLAPPSLSRQEARINADVRALAARTALCVLLTIPILVLVWAPIRDKGSLAHRAAEFALATGVLAAGYPIYAGSLRTLWYLRRADLGVLTSVSTLTTYAFSVVAFGFQAAGHPIAEPFFETLGLLVSLIYLGRTIQASTRKAALGAISSLAKLQPTTADVVTPDGVDTVDVRLLFYNDVIRVSAPAVVPTDGVIFAGQADIDESAITGESVPVLRGHGQAVHAGTTLIEGSVDVAVARLVGENSLASVIQAVMDAQSSASRFGDFADRMAAWLLPLASAAAVISFLTWVFVGHYVRRHPWGRSVIDAVTYAIAIMAVSCPCALTLAVPTISATCMAMSVRDGVVFRSSDALLSLSTIRRIAFDKTGTLSLGTLSVVQAYTGDALAAELVSSMTAASRHPVSVAVNQYLASNATPGADFVDRADPGLAIEYTVVPGGGVAGAFYDYPVLGGSAVFTGTASHPTVKGYLDAGLTVFVVTVGGHVVAAYGLADKARGGASELVAELSAANVAVSVLSGDHQAAVAAFAARIGLDGGDAHGGLSPEGKADAIAALQTSGPVAFVGDGVNDSIALSLADVGIGMGSGTDAAVLASDVVLLGTDIRRMLAAARGVAHIGRVVALAAIAWCGVYFTAAIVLASGAAVDFRIPPQYAGLGELVSVLPVLLLAVVAKGWGWVAARRRVGRA
ncbi:hypothetical protein Q8F55_008476 [Vanrija albida]|uniref:P-type ATPase A domain-containing protein n=1 Tax=Vanrija albida TaxID=181172 RepID=A0ABR3PQY6_9TREE